MDDKCLPCKMGKQHRKFHSSKQINSIPSTFELLHMDLFGPISTPSLDGKKYFLVIVDEYSRYTCVFFLKAKNEVANEIMIVQNQWIHKLSQNHISRTSFKMVSSNEKSTTYFLKSFHKIQFHNFSEAC